MCNDEHRELAEGLTTALANRGIELLAAHVVDRVAAGGRWHCADGCGNAGTVDDPSASPLAVAAVLDGRRLYARRAELQEVIDVIDPARADALADVIGDCKPDRRTSGRRGARRRRSGHRRGRAGGRRRGARRRRTGAAGVGADRPSGARHALRAGRRARTPGRPSRCGRRCRAPCRSRGGSRRSCCWRSRPTRAATVRWRACRWKRRCAATRRTGWRACWTPRCSRGCGPSRSAIWRSRATGWPIGSGVAAAAPSADFVSGGRAGCSVAGV